MPPIKPLNMEPDARPAMTVMPKMAVQKSSDGPNWMAIRARGGVKRIMTTMPKSPPTRDEIKQM